MSLIRILITFTEEYGSGIAHFFGNSTMLKNPGIISYDPLVSCNMPSEQPTCSHCRHIFIIYHCHRNTVNNAKGNFSPCLVHLIHPRQRSHIFHKVKLYWICNFVLILKGNWHLLKRRLRIISNFSLGKNLRLRIFFSAIFFVPCNKRPHLPTR